MDSDPHTVLHIMSRAAWTFSTQSLTGAPLCVQVDQSGRLRAIEIVIDEKALRCQQPGATRLRVV